MKRSAPRYLAFAPLPYRLFAYFDTIFDQLLVIEYQVLLQSGVGDVATLGGFLYRDITVGMQKLYRLGILFLALRTRAARQVVAQTQPLSFPLSKFQYFGIMRTQLSGEVRTVQSKFAGNLRYVVSYMVHAVTRRDGFLVFGMGFGPLSASLIYLDLAGFLQIAFDTIAFQHQVAMVGADIAGKSVERNSALPAYFDIGETGGSVQLQRRAIFGFRLRLAPSYPLTFFLFQGNVLDGRTGKPSVA